MQKLFNRLKKIKWRNFLIYIFTLLIVDVVFCAGLDTEIILTRFFKGWPHQLADLILVATVYILISLKRTKES